MDDCKKIIIVTKNNTQEAMNWCKYCGEVKRKNTKKYLNSII